MKKLFAITLAFLFLNGCAQTTSMMGPTYTMVKTGSILQAGSSAAGGARGEGQEQEEAPKNQLQNERLQCREGETDWRIKSNFLA